MKRLENLKLSNQEIVTGSLEKDYYKVFLPNQETQIFVKSADFLNTRYSAYMGWPYGMQVREISEKELFKIDFQLLSELTGEGVDINVEPFPKEPFVLFAVTEKYIPKHYLFRGECTLISIRITNGKKVKKIFQKKANAGYLTDPVSIVFPFLYILTKYILVKWKDDSGFTLVFKDLSKAYPEETHELKLFACYLQRYLKLTCDADFLHISV
jgi:hypothetical protein